MEFLETHFDDREALIAYVRDLAPWVEGEASSEVGRAAVAEERLGEIDPVQFRKTRNHLGGAVTKLSPFIRHGVVTLNRVRNHILQIEKRRGDGEKLIQELAWRDFWQRIYWESPDYIWEDVEPYKTGFAADEYAQALPRDVAEACTGVACIDEMIGWLLRDGWIHNHARMYIAAYVVHWRRICWQAGARWMLHHLIDGDPASNNLSWQWVASTFSSKPYIFNLDNVAKYSDGLLDVSRENNRTLAAEYEELTERLFPNLGKGDA